jgi:hypothetical protein
MIVVLGALISLIAISSLAIDVGIVWAARNQLQNAADAAALAGAANLIDPALPSVTASLAEAAAVDIASQNGTVSANSVNLPVSDVTLGNWDLTTGVFDQGVNLADPAVVSAVQVAARLDGVANGPVPAFFARVIGRNSFTVSASATAYLGWAGALAPGEIEIPVAIDCCKLRGADCANDYCATVSSNPPNPCALADPQNDGVTNVSCLEFSNTAEQNACWTSFDGEDPSVNSSDLVDIVSSGNPVEIGGGAPMYVDNGDKASVIKELADKFYGESGYNTPAGTDRYSPFDGRSDSWVVGIPVVACQSDDGCAGGSATTLVGVTCFEIREVEGAPGKLIRGRFLCDTDPLFDECDVGRTVSGGLDFGVRADIPVLVQ